MKRFLLFLLVTFSVFALAFSFSEKKLENGEDLIRLIHKTYSDKWYPHLTFKQDMFRYRDDSLIRNEVWVVAYSAPGRLHIRYKDFDTGRGWLVANDTLYSYNHDKLIGQRPRLHELMTLGLDAFIVSPEKIIPKLRAMKFDLSVLEETTINGKTVYQVGNPDTKCFWIHKDNMLFYGIRKTGDMGVKETFFENYRTFYEMPVATEIQYFQDGKMYLFEKYFDIRLPSTLPDSYFNPELFTQTRW